MIARIGSDRAGWLAHAFRDVLLPVLFIANAVLIFVSLVVLHLPSPEKWFLIDSHIYVRAAKAWVAGEDPWSQSYRGIYFAAPPPTLIPYSLVAHLPENLAVALLTLVGIVAAIAAVKLLRVQWWWLLWPPLVNAIFVGSLDACLPALLAGGAVAAGLSVFAKAYALIPAVSLWGVRAAGVAMLGVLVTIPFLPWSAFFQDLPRILDHLAEQSGGGLSSAGTWSLALVSVAALVVLDPQDAAFLVVPALWPNAQVHYSAVAMAYAVRAPIVAYGLSLQVPHAATAVAVIEAVLAIRRRRAAGVTGPRLFVGLAARRHAEPRSAEPR